MTDGSLGSCEQEDREGGAERGAQRGTEPVIDRSVSFLLRWNPNSECYHGTVAATSSNRCHTIPCYRYDQDLHTLHKYFNQTHYPEKAEPGFPRCLERHHPSYPASQSDITPVTLHHRATSPQLPCITERHHPSYPASQSDITPVTLHHRATSPQLPPLACMAPTGYPVL
ncbi:hypothetical protein RRG08_053246 [Elysia crispata]|uniref:Uncharacterized protein n=1 Tax=Elysia crispata TaxID=231223 RepID=A0AAE1E1W3_9GAST|nr:hypothetical protein RRG08_053246 [Elysia crispata]